MVLSFSGLWCNSDVQPPCSLTPTVSKKNLVSCFPQRKFPLPSFPVSETCGFYKLNGCSQRRALLNRCLANVGTEARMVESALRRQEPISWKHQQHVWRWWQNPMPFERARRKKKIKENKENTDGHSFLSVTTFSWNTIIEQHIL